MTEKRDLFRKQVMEARLSATAQFGRPAAIMPPAWTWFIVGLFAFFCLLGLFLTHVDYARKETVRGNLRSIEAEAHIYASDVGTISRVFVQNGDYVTVGQPLFEINRDRFLTTGERRGAADASALNTEIGTLLSRRETAHSSHQTTLDSLAAQESHNRSRVERLAKSLDALDQRQLTMTSRLDRVTGFLEEGLVPENELFQVRTLLEDINTQIGVTEAEHGQAQFELAQIKISRRQAEADLAITLDEIDERVSQLSRLLRETESGHAYQIVATVDGRVTAQQARVGEAVSTSNLLTAIVPADSELIAEMYLPSSAIAFVKEGQSVKLRYDALPYQKFGFGNGRILSVAEAGLLANAYGINSNTEELLFRVEVALGSQSMEAFSRPVSLQSGMEFSADIILENRRLIEWLLAELGGAGQ